MRNGWIVYVFGAVVAGIGVSCKEKAELPAEVSLAMEAIPAKVDYIFDVKPILSDRCFACHGPDQSKQKAGLRLDVEENAYSSNSESGRRAIVPGNSYKSELVSRILSQDPEVRMPTPESHLSLTTEEKAILIRWVEQGAEYKQHWSFSKIEKPAVPKVGNTRWPVNDIDQFVLNKIEAKGLKPAPESEKTTLLRRVYLDLTGLPPAPEDVDRFLKDTSPRAYENVVDQLLASESYGEHQAAFWMDAARYADTHGYQDDVVRTAWPFRDWVIKAFNQNLPYDKFVTYQLAGDLLPKPTREQLVATAFNRMHPQNQEGGIISEEYRTEYVADRVNTFGKLFLGLTVECARCHDHKYDPISQKDYFSLYAFFNSNNENGQVPYNGEACPSITLPDEQADKKLNYIRATIAKEKSKLDPERYREKFTTWLQEATAHPDKVRKTINEELTFHFTFDEPEGKEFTNLVDPRLRARSEGDSAMVSKASIPGRIGRARFIEGGNAIWIGSDNVGHFERNQPFTVSTWFNIQSPAIEGPLIQKSNGINVGYRGWNVYRMADGRIRVVIGTVWPESAVEVQTEEKFPLDKWTHFAFAYDGLSKAKGLKLFIDGKPAKVIIYNDNLTQSIIYGKNKNLQYGKMFAIGRLSDVHNKNFSVDELRIYSRSLSPLEMLSLFTQKNEVERALKTPVSKQTPYQQQGLMSFYLARIDYDHCVNLEETHRLLGEETDILNTQPDVMVMKELPTPRKTFILNRGVYDAPGKEVEANTPEHLVEMPRDFPRNRLGLARWLLHEDNPLFARVTVNQFWQQLFGKGLVNTSDDFGNQGDLPEHPELLDWLAIRLREMNWDLKAFRKMLVMSATYRQSSVGDSKTVLQDPDNRFYTRSPNYRLSAEQIRDNALAASGILINKVGGPSVFPYQPKGVWEALAASTSLPPYPEDSAVGLYRRSLYTIMKRTAPHPALITFDASERNACVVKRQKTSTPLQALITLNDPQYLEASRLLAGKAIKKGNTPDQRITYAFKALTSRAPRPKELGILKDLYEMEHKDFRANPKRMKSLLTIGRSPIDESVNPVELASYTIVASTIMNFDEFLIKR